MALTLVERLDDAIDDFSKHCNCGGNQEELRAHHSGCPYRLMHESANQIENLTILSNGCKLHRAYRAHQKPKAGCKTCEEMFAAREALIA